MVATSAFHIFWFRTSSSSFNTVRVEILASLPDGNVVLKIISFGIGSQRVTSESNEQSRNWDMASLTTGSSKASQPLSTHSGTGRFNSRQACNMTRAPNASQSGLSVKYSLSLFSSHNGVCSDVSMFDARSSDHWHITSRICSISLISSTGFISFPFSSTCL